jgi:histone H1/5
MAKTVKQLLADEQKLKAKVDLLNKQIKEAKAALAANKNDMKAAKEAEKKAAAAKKATAKKPAAKKAAKKAGKK